MQDSKITIKLFGSEGCPDCEQQKEILKSTSYPFDFINVDSEDEKEIIEVLKYEIDNIPTLVVTKEENGKKRFFRHCGILASHKIEIFIKKI